MMSRLESCFDDEMRLPSTRRPLREDVVGETCSPFSRDGKSRRTKQNKAAKLGLDAPDLSIASIKDWPPFCVRGMRPCATPPSGLLRRLKAHSFAYTPLSNGFFFFLFFFLASIRFRLATFSPVAHWRPARNNRMRLLVFFSFQRTEDGVATPVPSSRTGSHLNDVGGRRNRWGVAAAADAAPVSARRPASTVPRSPLRRRLRSVCVCVCARVPPCVSDVSDVALMYCWRSVDGRPTRN